MRQRNEVELNADAPKVATNQFRIHDSSHLCLSPLGEFAAMGAVRFLSHP